MRRFVGVNLVDASEPKRFGADPHLLRCRLGSTWYGRLSQRLVPGWDGALALAQIVDRFCYLLVGRCLMYYFRMLF